MVYGVCRVKILERYDLGYARETVGKHGSGARYIRQPTLQQVLL